MSERTLKQKAIHGVAWYGGTRWVIQGVSWIVTILVARILSPADYGLFGFAVLVTGMAGLINELGLGATVIQRRDLQNEDLSAVFWLSLASSLTIYTLAWFTAPFIATFFHQMQLVAVLRVIMLSFIIGSLRVVPWNLLTKRVDFRRRSLVEVFANVIASVTTLMMAYAGRGVWALVTSLLCREVVLTTATFILEPWSPRGRVRLASVQKVLGFGLNVSAGSVAWYLYSNADFLIVGKLLGQQLLGIYTMVYQLATLPADRITAVINQVAFPVYSELQDQPERLKNYFLKVAMMVSIVTLPLLAGLSAVVDIAVPLVLTQKWSPLITPLRIMCWVGMMISVSALTGAAVMAKGRPDLCLRYNLACLIVMPAGFLFGTRFGIEGVCWAWLILYPFMTAMWYATTRKLLGYEWRELFSTLKPAAICTMAMLVAVFTTRQLVSSDTANTIRLSVLITAGVVSYLSVFALAFHEQLSEIRTLLASQERTAGAVPA